MSHTIGFWINLVMMLFVIGFTAWGLKYRVYMNFFHRFGPICLVVTAALLIMADPTRHVLQDQGWWPAPGSNQYRPGCDDESFKCLSVVGWLFTVVFTYSGFILLVIGSLWNANIIAKLRLIREKFAEIRARRAAEKQ